MLKAARGSPAVEVKGQHILRLLSSSNLHTGDARPSRVSHCSTTSLSSNALRPPEGRPDVRNTAQVLSDVTQRLQQGVDRGNALCPDAPPPPAVTGHRGGPREAAGSE